MLFVKVGHNNIIKLRQENSALVTTPYTQQIVEKAVFSFYEKLHKVYQVPPIPLMHSSD